MLKALAGGFAGAAVLTLLHNFLRKYDEAPRLDRLGEEAATKTIETIGGDVPEGGKLYNMTLAGDIISNALYYSSAAAHPKQQVLAGTGLGILAGLGAVYLPEKMGLKAENTASSTTKKLITIALYTAGGLVAGAVMRSLSRN